MRLIRQISHEDEQEKEQAPMGLLPSPPLQGRPPSPRGHTPKHWELAVESNSPALPRFTPCGTPWPGFRNLTPVPTKRMFVDGVVHHSREEPLLETQEEWLSQPL